MLEQKAQYSVRSLQTFDKDNIPAAIIQKAAPSWNHSATCGLLQSLKPGVRPRGQGRGAEAGVPTGGRSRVQHCDGRTRGETWRVEEGASTRGISEIHT
eukprot:2351516-Amphidinium_carterae.1